MFALMTLIWTILSLNLLQVCNSATYTFDLTVSDGTDLKLWYRFRDYDSEQSPWHYLGALDSSGTYTFTMDTSTTVSATYYRFYLGSYGLGYSDSLTINSFGLDNGNTNEVVDYGTGYTWICDTETTGCCVIYMRAYQDDVYDEQTYDPCNDLYEFESNREGTIPTVEPTDKPTIVPTNEPTNEPTDSS